ncbi:ABC transporter permease [candidate division KSB1 bacterium]
MDKKTRQSPKLGEWILRRLIKSRNSDYAIGDFNEIYNRMANDRGIFIAWCWFWFQILTSFHRFINNIIYWSLIMFKNYFKIAFRNIKRQKAYSFINISGLALGMACCILILLWVQDELSYDKFHENFKNIYRVMSEGGKYNWKGVRGTPEPLGPALKEELPEIANFARFASHSRMVFRYKDRAFYEDGGIIADASLFEIFSFPILKGNPASAFSGPFDIMLSKEMAEKYFGDEDPVGKTMQVEGFTVTVTGVFENIPKNSHIRFDFVNSFNFIKELSGFGTGWGSFNFVTYILLREDADYRALGAKINDIAAKNNCPQVTSLGIRMSLQPLKDVYLTGSGYSRNFEALSSSTYVYIFSVIAFFVLFIACVNFINLSTARSAKRAREIGLRKVVGSHRRQLLRQFFGESFLYVLIAFLISLIVVNLALPLVNNISGKELTFNYLNYKILAGSFAILIVTAIIAGFYPAVFLSSFKPVRVIRGENVADTGNSWLRKILVVTQFSLSILLIICTTIIIKQQRFINNKNLGFEKDNIVFIQIKGNIGKQYNTVKNELLNVPNITGVTAQNYLYSGTTWRTTAFDWEGKDPEHNQDLVTSRVEYNYFETFNMEIIEGRPFSKEDASGAERAYILNESAVKQMKLDNPVGKWFSWYDRKGTIVGIAKDVHFRSLHEKIAQRVFIASNDFSEDTDYGLVMIKIKPDVLSGSGQTLSAALNKIENIWKDINPSTPFEYHFLDETYENLYKIEKRTGTILNYFTALTIIIACLGLFGLASFMAERRTKEIGIRKVLGASTGNLIKLLTREFILLVAVANIIAWPVGYFVMKKVFQVYAYHTDITVFEFLLSAFAAVLIAIITVSFQAVKTANKNPVNSLRYE